MPDRSAIKQRFSIIGNAPELNTAIDVALQIAPTEVTALVVGENGTGKDVFSKIIYHNSLRKHQDFIAINCGAIPEGTIDSELFGHEKGAFTSAYDARRGYFEEVNGGVIFLDEIAEMPLATQSRLLRVLENGEFLRVGSSRVQKTDVRVIAATNKNLLEMIRRGKFREDLYFRLNTVTIYVPPLRERGDDIELLFRYFAREFGDRYGRPAVKLAPDAVRLLYEYHWPGNVRELRNFAEKITVLAGDREISAEELRKQMPLTESQLPVLLPPGGLGDEDERESGRGAGPGGPPSGQEYDFLVKMLFDLKNDVSDVKRALAALYQQQFQYAASEQPYPPGRYDLALPDYRPPRPSREYAEPPFPDERYAPAYDQDREPDEDAEEPEEIDFSLENQEKDLISKALVKFNHNRKKAANELGISERTLYRKIRNYGIDE